MSDEDSREVELNALRVEVETLTAMLLEMRTGFSEHGWEMFANWRNHTHLERAKIADWFHRRWEEEERAREALFQRALAKLTPEEREALGLEGER